MRRMAGIEPGEHRQRQARLRELAARRGLRAVVALSRGGGTHDRTADALWLAGLAASQPFVGDLPGHGVPAHTMGGFWGHGLGLGWEPPWLGPACNERLEPGMCLAIERRAAVDGLGGAQYEDDVLVGDDGPELLTRTG